VARSSRRQFSLSAGSGEFPEVRHLAEEEVTAALVAEDTAEAADMAAAMGEVTAAEMAVEVAAEAVVEMVAVAVVAEVTVEAVAADTGTSRFRVKQTYALRAASTVVGRAGIDLALR
jgi:hypothetical protein